MQAPKETADSEAHQKIDNKKTAEAIRQFFVRISLQIFLRGGIIGIISGCILIVLGIIIKFFFVEQFIKGIGSSIIFFVVLDVLDFRILILPLSMKR